MKEILLQIIILVRSTASRGRKGGTAIAVRKDIPYNHVYLSFLVSLEATGFCIPIDSSDILLEVLCKSPGRACIDASLSSSALDVSPYC
jgi:hypothetical protein